MSEYSIEDLVKGFRLLGIEKNDVLLVRAALNQLGNVQGKRPDIFIRALIKAVGQQGTISALAFTQAFRFPEKHKNYVFDSKTPPITGGFAAAMVNWEGAVRSSHPTNSWVAIGKNAEKLLSGHDENTSCFLPIKALMELEGKLILVGCISDSPGFSTVHYAQYQLGLSTRNVNSRREGVRIRKGSTIKMFKRVDIPGCSSGFHNFYGDYVREGLLRAAFVGDAYSIAIRAKDSYKIEYRLLKQNPKKALCSNPDCRHCRASLYYNLLDFPKFYLRKYVSYFRNSLKKTIR